MSLRSVGALPECLHGRRAVPYLGIFVVPNKSLSFLIHRCSFSSISQFHFRHEKRSQASAATGISSFATVKAVGYGENSLRSLKDADAPTQSSTEPSKPISRSAPNQNPNSHHDGYRYTTLEYEPDQKGTDLSSHALAGAWAAGWEKLHDDLVQIRRTDPEKTRQVFKKQRDFARRFVGDVSNYELATLEFKCKWYAVARDEQLKLMPILLIGSLAESAAQTLFVISNITVMSRSFRIRMNCLRSVAIMYWKDLQSDEVLKAMYEMQIERLRSPVSWPEDGMPAVLLQNLLFWSTREQCESVINSYFERYSKSDSSVLFALIDHYLRHADQENALKYFRQLPQHTLQNPTPALQVLRDKLLRLDMIVRTESGANFKFLPQLLDLGLPSDESLHNAVIETAILNGLPDVAWDLYQYLESSKFQTNARSHLVLLREAFQRGDLQRVNEVMTAIHRREDLARDQYLIAYSMNIVRNIYCYDQKLSSHEALIHIMALYDRAHDRGPLVKLGLVQPPKVGNSLPQPTPTLLAFTIWTYILTQTRDRDVLRLWAWIKYLIQDGDTQIVEMAGFDIVYNGVILFLARKSSNLSKALQVVEYMLSHRLCLPTSRTWSILLCSFLRHGQLAQAKSLLRMMQQKGFNIREIDDEYHEYLPEGYNLRDLLARLDDPLDDRRMPAEIQTLMSESESLRQ